MKKYQKYLQSNKGFTLRAVLACIVLICVLVAFLAFPLAPSATAQGPGRIAWTSTTNLNVIGSDNATDSVVIVSAQTDAKQDRQVFAFSNTSTNNIGVRFSNLYATNAQADVWIPAGQTVTINAYGYRGAISGRASIDTASGLVIHIQGN